MIAPQDVYLEVAVRRLKALGHGKIVYLGGTGALATRWRSLTRAIEAVGGIEAVRLEMPFDTPLAELRDAYVEMLESQRDATALFVHSWNIAATNAALRARRETIPRDWSVVTFTDSRYTVGLTDPPLSSLAVDSIEFGRQSMALVEDWLGGNPPPNVAVLDLAVWNETESLGPARTG